jgi:hypothetical protein
VKADSGLARRPADHSYDQFCGEQDSGRCGYIEALNRLDTVEGFLLAAMNKDNIEQCANFV